MLSNILPIDLAVWEQMIDHHSLTAAPETRLIDIVAQLNQAQLYPEDFMGSVCVFVVVDTRLLGVLPTSTIFSLIVAGVDLTQVTIAEVMSQPSLTLSAVAITDIAHLATHLSHHPAGCIAIVDRQGSFVGAIAPHRLQSYLCQHLTQLQQQIVRLQTENSYLQQSHPLSLSQYSHQSTPLKYHKPIDRALLEAIPDLMIRMSREGVYLDFLPSRHFKTIMTYPQMIGKNVFEVLPPDLAHQQMQYVEQALQTGDPQTYEYQITIDGVLSDQEARISPSGVDEVIVIVRDIGDRKRRETQLVQAQVELAQAKTDLEGRIEERTTALKKTYQELQQEIAERYRIEQMLLKNQTYLQIIHHVSACLTANSSVEQIISITLEQLSQYFPTLRVTYLVLDEDNTLSVLHHIDPPESCPVVFNTSLVDAPEWVSALRQLKPVVSNDIIQTRVLASQKEALLSEGIRALLDIPLKHSDTQIGVLSFESFKPRQWSDYEVSTLIEVVRYLSLILQEVNTQHLREWTEAALLQAQQTNALLATALEKAGDAVEITNAECVIEYVNSAWEDMTGYCRTEAIGKTPKLLLRGVEQNEEFYQQIEATIATGQIWRGKITARRQNGGLFCQEVAISPVLNLTGNIGHYVAVKRDVTERQQAEEQIRASLHEKELLLKEVHHRVKNNMQVICSIFSLQAQSVTDPDTLSILADSQNRIRAMALIHEKLYQSTSLAQINFADYTRNLVQSLVSTYRDGEANKIQLELNVSNVSLDIDTAIPCGLIINELVSNSLKHAFKSQHSGVIMITLVNTDQDQLHLVVRDDGIGLPADLNVRQVDSLGLRLICALSRQLNGKWNMYSDRGTVFEIIF